MKSVSMYQSSYGILVLGTVLWGAAWTEDQLDRLHGEHLDLEGVWIHPDTVREWNCARFHERWGFWRRLRTLFQDDDVSGYEREWEFAHEEPTCLTDAEVQILRTSRRMHNW